MLKAKNKPSKSEVLRKLLVRERGATIAELSKSAGWQEHSVRAFLTGVRKTSDLTKHERSDGLVAYRIARTNERISEEAAA